MTVKFHIILMLVAIVQHASALEVPVDTETYIYGLGTDNSYNGAQSAALSDIALKLSARVSTETEIKQRKEGNLSKVITLSKTKSFSRDVDVPSFEVIRNENKNGLWIILIRVERTHVQRAVFHQLESLGEEISSVLNQYQNQYGPKCYHSLSKKKKTRNKLSELIPAYIGSGAKDQAEKKHILKIKEFDNLLANCKQANKYRLVYSTKVDRKFNDGIVQFLNSEGFQVTASQKGTGAINVDLAIKQSFAYKNHLTVITLNLEVVDEHKSQIFKDKLKARGSSFRSKEDALKNAQKSLVTKMKSLISAQSE